MKEAPALLLAAGLRSRGWIATAVAGSLLTAVVALVTPALVAAALDATLHREPLGPPFSRLAAVFVLAVAAAAARAYAGLVANATSVNWLRRRLLRRVLDAGPAGTSGFAPGDLTSRLTGACGQVGRTGLTLLDSAVGTMTALGGVVALALIDWRLAGTFLLGLPPAYVIVRLFMRQGSAVFARYQALQASIAARLMEAVGGARTIRAGGTLPMETTRVLAPLPELAETGYRTWDLQRATSWQMGLVLPILEVLTLTVGGYGVVAGRLTPGELIAAVGYVAIALGLFDQIDTLLGLGAAQASAGRVLEVLRFAVPARGDLDLPPATGGRTVAWRGVTIAGDDRPLLDAVDLEVPAGASVAVVGRSGAGKSSLAALVGRLREPDAGAVLIDGVPVEDLSDEALRRTVSYAFERPALLGETIGGTIALARPDTPAEGVRDAARAAWADTFIDRLPGGYQTPLADAPLSGGEAQRLGLARALLHDGQIVVLDDATSSLDTATEARVAQALAGNLADRTRIVVAHRPATAAWADTVVWLDGGRVRATGRHADLWDDPDYRALFGTSEETVEDEWT